SALCLRAAVSKPVREMSCKICEKILHTLFKAESSSDSLLFANSTYQRLSAFFFPAALSTAELIWTKMVSHITFFETMKANESTMGKIERRDHEFAAVGRKNRR